MCPSRPVPSLLRGFSAPVKLSGVPLAQLQFLAAHDTDPFVRWESGQQYATHLLLAMAAAWRRGETPAVDQGLIDALAATLRDADKDPAFAAEALTLPGEAFLADQMAVADVDAIHAARDMRTGGDRPGTGAALRATYERLTDTGAVSASTARRSAGARCAMRASPISRRTASADGIARAKAQFDARTEHDRRAGGSGGAVGDRLSGAARGARRVPCALAWR